jgi:hypothetical protein
MIKRALLVAFVSASVFACASDPNQKAEDAHDAQLKSERKQSVNAAEDRSDGRVQAAENQRDNAPRTTAATNEGTTAADAKLTEARAVYRAKATARLEKADAKTVELKSLVQKAGNKASTAARDSLATVDTQRAMVARDLETFPSYANDQFENAKTTIDGKLDALEGLVKKAASEVDSFKK